MKDTKIKLWLGIGGYLMLNAAAVAAPSADSGHQIMAANGHDDHAILATNGEGGEGGEAGYTNEDPDQVFTVNLLLTKGHLHIAQEMAALGQWDHAAAHAQHPAAETYDRISPELKRRGAAPFESELDALVMHILENKNNNNNVKPIDQTYTPVIEKINAALATIEASKRHSPLFTITSAVALLKQASAEYEIGVKQGKIVNLQEYQDANGFIWIADEMIAGLDKSLPGVTEIIADLAKLKAGWAPKAGMDSMVTPEPEILSAISRIELKAGKIR